MDYNNSGSNKQIMPKIIPGHDLMKTNHHTNLKKQAKDDNSPANDFHRMDTHQFSDKCQSV